jgi:hypothetical protein
VTGNANVIYKLEDNTGTITSLTFMTLINPNLPQASIKADFTCGQDSLGQGGLGYFLHCAVGYTPTNGLGLTHGVLTYSFFGVEAPDPDELCPTQDCEINEQEGLPAGGSFFVHLLGWIPDAPGCGPLYKMASLPSPIRSRPLRNRSHCPFSQEGSCLWRESQSYGHAIASRKN